MTSGLVAAASPACEERWRFRTCAVFSREAIKAAQRVVRQAMPPTPQQRWLWLDQRVGAQVWVNNENHTPTGAFKVRGGLTLLRRAVPA